MSTKEYPIVDNAESFEAALARVREAQKIFIRYSGFVKNRSRNL